MNEFIPEKYENLLRKDPVALDSVYEVAGDNDVMRTGFICAHLRLCSIDLQDGFWMLQKKVEQKDCISVLEMLIQYSKLPR